MSSIPYNYGKYVDDTQKLHDQGHVDAGKQVQSPASAGSRGLNKTVQFTKDPTQMKMGESITMEDMKTLISRIDRIQSGAEAVQEAAGLTDQQKKGLEAIAKKYKGREGYNGDFLPIGYIKAIMSTGVGTDGMDGEEVEAFAKKLGKDVSDIEDEWEDFETLDNITNAMKGDINDVLGNGWDVNQKLADAAKDYLYDLDESYEPFPEADEFNIEEDEDFEEVLGPLGFPEDETELFDAEYRGRKVPLNKPMRGDVKKFKVYVKDPKSGNVKKVNFGHGGSSARKAGQKTMKIRKSNPKARKSFRARHNCANPGPKTKARYWSCRKW